MRCASCSIDEYENEGRTVKLFGRSKAEKWGEKTRITYFLQTDKELHETTVVRYVDNSAHAAVEATRGHVLSLAKRLMERNQEEFVRWWVQDKDGNVLESHDDFTPPARPTMWS